MEKVTLKEYFTNSLSNILFFFFVPVFPYKVLLNGRKHLEKWEH